MKLKYVGAAMCVLGVVSCQAFAATNHTKHKKHMRHHQAQVVTSSVQTYKDEVLPQLVEACPKTDMYTLLMDRLDQNTGRAKPTVGCDNPISFAGGINFDTKWGNRSIGYMGENNARLALNDAYLNVFGNVNEWTTAFMSLGYSNYNDALVTTFNTRGQRPGVYSSNQGPDTLNLEQAFITIRNWNYMPIFLQLGKQFQPFGRYEIHPMTRSMTQVLSETLRTSAEIGFIVPMGLHGAAYVFDNTLRSANSAGIIKGHTQTNYGAELGYDMMSDQLGFDIGLGYMYNMVGVNDVAYAVGKFNGGSAPGGIPHYINTVGAGSLYADVNSGPFSLGIRYVSAISRFSSADLGNNAFGIVASTRGAKPWAAGIVGAYGYTAWGKNQNLYLGYQASGDAINIFLPKSRWLAGIGVDMWKNTNVGLEWNHDIDYSTGTGGTGNGSNAVNLRVGVKFG